MLIFGMILFVKWYTNASPIAYDLNVFLNV